MRPTWPGARVRDKEVALLAHWPIRNKLFLAAAILLLMVACLAFSSFQGVYSYRRLARGISSRAAELPRAMALMRSAGQLHCALPADGSSSASPVSGEFQLLLLNFKEALRRYRDQLQVTALEDALIGDTRLERETVKQIDRRLAVVERVFAGQQWVLDPTQVSEMRSELAEIDRMCGTLPEHLHQRMQHLRDEVRGRYRVWIILTWITSVMAGLLLFQLVRYLYVWVFRPLVVLIRGSRRVAAGSFEHRIQLDSNDEMAELAGAMNAMTGRFEQVRDDLDQQVKQRTREVLRNEQLASVGFLAAGVAHEINNPLASIAWCAESLESRLHDLVPDAKTAVTSLPADQLNILEQYLRTIQNEAFRCKGITEKLLDYSRMDAPQRQPTNLRQLVGEVVEMVKHLSIYRNRRIRTECPRDVIVEANPQEMKQVVLNLLTNALGSLQQGGLVRLALEAHEGQARLSVKDNGCGMNQEVLDKIFEPFFTKRRDNQGTGLGLSISYRIVTDHGGQILVQTGGEGKGSEFTVILPLADSERSHDQEPRKQAA